VQKHTATHLPHTATHLPHTATHLPHTATHLPHTATHLPHTATHLPHTATYCYIRFRALLLQALGCMRECSLSQCAAVGYSLLQVPQWSIIALQCVTSLQKKCWKDKDKRRRALPTKEKSPHATHYITLQCNTMHHTATHGNMLQHMATPCNTRQRICWET